jgi:hypothetical protein
MINLKVWSNMNVDWRRASLTILSSIAVAVASIITFAQFTGPLTFGTIAFYGYDGLDIEAAKAAMPLKVGDSIPIDRLGDLRSQTKKAMLTATGSDITDFATVCCDAQGKWLVYVGLAGKSSRPFIYNRAPTGTERLPADILALVTEIGNENMKAVLSGNAKEDDSHGYALMSYPPERKLQEALHQIASKREKSILSALETCSNGGDRAAAAMALGYAKRSDRQIHALVSASRDTDEGARNNATRALLVIAGSEHGSARKIPASDFIAMLNSGTWTDRNKGTALLSILTVSRDPALLKRLREEALPSLVEMANWDTGHATSACLILGRMAGIPDGRIKDLIAGGNSLEIIQAAEKVSP